MSAAHLPNHAVTTATRLSAALAAVRPAEAAHAVPRSAVSSHVPMTRLELASHISQACDDVLSLHDVHARQRPSGLLTETELLRVRMMALAVFARLVRRVHPLAAVRLEAALFPEDVAESSLGAEAALSPKLLRALASPIGSARKSDPGAETEPGALMDGGPDFEATQPAVMRLSHGREHESDWAVIDTGNGDFAVVHPVAQHQQHQHKAAKP